MTAEGEADSLITAALRYEREQARAAIAQDIADTPRRCDGCSKVSDTVRGFVIHQQRFKFCPGCRPAHAEEEER